MRLPPAPALGLLASLVAALALGGLVGAAPARAGADDEVRGLVRDFEAHLARRDEEGYRAQGEVLARLADLRTKGARAALADLLAKYGPADRQVAALVLAATVRRGTPKDLDAAVAWMEARRDPLLLDLLAGVVAAAEEPATREHVLRSTLPRSLPAVKVAVVRGLALRGDVAAVMPLLLLLREPDADVRAEAMAALGLLRDARALAPLLVFLRHEDPRMRDAAARALGSLGNPAALEPLRRVVTEEAVPIVVEAAARALADLDLGDAIPALLDRLAREAGGDLRLEDALLRALRRLSGKALGRDLGAWRAWWEAAKGPPFRKAPPDPAGTTVEGPRYYEFPVRSSRLVFVLDVSRSMAWNDRLVLAKQELVKVLERLPRTTRFNIVVYSDTARAWEERLTEARPAAVQRAIQFVERLDPENGTNTWDALRLALADPEADTLFFLSDGSPTVGDVVDPALILSEVRRANRWRHVRIHGIALLRGEPPEGYRGLEDPDRAEGFMRRLAGENDGEAKLIR